MRGVDLESNNLASWDISHTTTPETDRFSSLFYDRELGAMDYSNFKYASFGHYRACYNICSISSLMMNSVYIMNGFFIMYLVSIVVQILRYMHIFGQNKND